MDRGGQPKGREQSQKIEGRAWKGRDGSHALVCMVKECFFEANAPGELGSRPKMHSALPTEAENIRQYLALRSDANLWRYRQLSPDNLAPFGSKYSQ